MIVLLMIIVAVAGFVLIFYPMLFYQKIKDFIGV